MTRNRLLLCGLALALALAGCKKSKPATEAEEGPSRQDVNRGIGKMLPAVGRVSPENDLRSIAQFYALAASAGSPRRVEDLGIQDPQLLKAIQEGQYVVVLNGPPAQKVVAYEKDAPANGGLVATRDGAVSQMTAADLQAALQGR